MQLLNIRALGLTAVVAAIALAGCGGGSSPNPNNTGPFTVDGEIRSSDFFDSDDNRYYDIFQVEAIQSGVAEVEMGSRDVDAQLFIYRRRGADDYGGVIAENDDINSNTTDARVTFDVTRGQIYRVIVTSARARQFGDYRVFFSREFGRPLIRLPKTLDRTAPGVELPKMQPKPEKAIQ